MGTNRCVWDHSYYSASMESPTKSEGPDTREVVERVKGKLQGYLAEAARATETSWHAVQFAHQMIGLRKQLGDVLRVVQAQHEASRHALLDAVWVIAHRRPEALASVSRSDLVRNWTQLLIDASDKVERDEYWAARYRESDSPEEKALVAAASKSASAALRDL